MAGSILVLLEQKVPEGIGRDPTEYKKSSCLALSLWGMGTTDGFQ